MISDEALVARARGGIAPLRTAVLLIGAVLAGFLALALGTQDASAAQFERGDVLVSSSEEGPEGSLSAIQRYSPDGALRSTFAAGDRAETLCLSPDGKYLIAPGAGLFDSSGNELPSRWKSAQAAGECAVDGYGQVYVAGGPTGGEYFNAWGTFRKYDIQGDLLATYTVPVHYLFGRNISSLDLAPDQCTIYYNAGGSNTIERFDACSRAQEGQLSAGGPNDGIRLRPNGQIVAGQNYGAELYEGIGENLGIRFWGPASGNGYFPFVGIAPDGSSFWLGASNHASRWGAIEGCSNVYHYDLASSHLISYLHQSCGASTAGMAVYGTPGVKPAIRRVSPKSGSAAGGTAVTITGTGFTGVTSVKFGPTSPAASFTVNSPTSITVIAPGATAGAADVLITAGGSTSELSPRDHFVF